MDHCKMDDFAIIDDLQIEKMLKWDQVIAAVRQSLISVTTTRLPDVETKGKYKDLRMNNPKKIVMGLASGRYIVHCMPAYVEGVELNPDGIKESSLSCKMLNIFNGNTDLNPPLPTVSGYLYLYDNVNGRMQAVLGADVITEWRTAAVSCVATKLIWESTLDGNGRKVLAVMGAGDQGRAHAISFQDQFRFDEIRIWNRTPTRAQKLVDELKIMMPKVTIVFCKTGKECVQDADVIVTATISVATIVQDDWVKDGSHINVVGVGKVSEISPDLYKRADVYAESKDVIASETPHINALAELGELELGLKTVRRTPNRITIFQSRGMGIHDSVVARLVYNIWKREKSTKFTNSTSIKQLKHDERTK